MSMTVFDIETGPLPEDKLREIVPPFDRSTIKHPGEFDLSTVKTGNLKDQAKIAEKIQEARQKHAEAVANYDETVRTAELKYWSDIIERAALSATTGQVVAIGYRVDDKSVIDSISDSLDESEILCLFWNHYRAARKNSSWLVGFNSNGFDVPFIIQRSLILGVGIPTTILNNGKWLDPVFVDLMAIWSAGNSRNYVSLDAACRACGLGSKPDGVDGAMFHKLYADPSTREQAIDYLMNDLDMTWRLASRLGWYL